jgi:SAM-dependent methyltransferase
MDEATGGEALTPDDPAYAGQKHYTSRFLRIYDPLVLGFFGRFIWRCPTARLVEHYNRHLGQRHLDVGPGTGSLLARARLPEAFELTLLDPNVDVLVHSSRRLARLRPATAAADVLKPLPLDQRFDSVAMNYVWHCLPAPLERKSAAVRNVAAVLETDGVLFGATVLGERQRHTWLSNVALRQNNRQGIFDNLDDTLEGLQATLAASFETVEVELIGCVALFSAARPRSEGS